MIGGMMPNDLMLLLQLLIMGACCFALYVIVRCASFKGLGMRCGAAVITLRVMLLLSALFVMFVIMEE